MDSRSDAKKHALSARAKQAQDEQIVKGFAARLRELRTSRPHPDRPNSDAHMPQRLAARRAGLDRGFWSRMERGQSEPTLTSLLRIQHGLGVDSIETLLGPTASTRLGQELGQGGGSREAK